MQKIASGIFKLTFGTPEEFTPVSVLKPVTCLEALNALEDHPLPFLREDIHFQPRQGSVLLEIPLEPEEEVYGLGLQLKSFRQSGSKKKLRTNSDPSADLGDSHAPVPFYVSTAGYAILVDTARYATFFSGGCKRVGSKQDLEGFESAGTEKGHWEVKKGSGNMLVDIPAAQGVDIYVFCGGDMKDAVSRYNLFSGGGALPPMWGLGVMYRADWHADQEDVLQLARQIREDEMPCDMFGLEPGWQTNAYSCTYVWDSNRFPDEKRLIQDLNDMGYRLNLWEHAYVHPDSPVFPELKPYSADSYVWDGLVPDFTQAEARKAFTDIHQPFIEAGLSGFKLDECDNGDYIGNWGFPDFARFPGGADGEQMHSLFGQLYQQTMLAPFKAADRRTYGQVRASHALAAPYPYVLYSDLYDHEDFVQGLATASFSGLLWSPEVRQTATREELLRRIGAVIFSPLAVLNCYMIPSPPWKQFDHDKNHAGEWLEDWPQLAQQCRKLLQIRMSLIPYLYAAFGRYRQQGVPPIRPLVMDYPGDSEVLDCFDQFMVGEDLMAAPVVYGNGDTRKIYLPQGRWYERLNGEWLNGGQWITRQVAEDEVPLYIKQGALIPWAEPVLCVRDDTVFNIEPVLYGAKAGECSLLCDDAVSYSMISESLPFATIKVTQEGGLSIEEQDIISERYSIAGVKYVPDGERG
ncbi:TIM-barrel domain-containing protein [Paenibacillus sp. FSL H8-0259]|uniref:TIM-barrel domain-containing protein n=1 Tax=Paenibacillus sp. FSL H8-0259 TaxID=1920423 RepID=UPI00096BEAEC|nr:TIM-barrel domain-containing protein [Paenibacillus sp. FSL H8-0259]OMF21531.1 hypothetical protein BK132_32735 [Paenibacillus sp. FSL H8-0259]